MVSVRDITDFLDDTLGIDEFDDYAPNGLQVEASDTVDVVACTVSANATSIARAVDAGADLLVAHHGFFWRNEPRTLTGIRGRRVAALFDAGVSLAGYHLPLDAHPEHGNAAGVLETLGVERGTAAPFAGVGRIADLDAPVPVDEALGRLESGIGRAPLAAFAHGPDEIRRVAVVTGAAPGLLPDALDAGADLYVTGEVSEQSQGLCVEHGATMACFGHHATERFGPRALAGLVAEEFGVETTFVDVDNPA